MTTSSVMFRYVSFQELYALESNTHTLNVWGKQIKEDSETSFKHNNQKYLFWFTGPQDRHLTSYSHGFVAVEVAESHALGHGIATYHATDFISGEETVYECPEAYTQGIPSDYSLSLYPASKWVFDGEIQEECDRINFTPDSTGYHSYVWVEDNILYGENDISAEADLRYLKWLLKLRERLKVDLRHGEWLKSYS